MEWILRENTRPGAIINELKLARQFGVAPTGIREFLNRFQRFGLIEKRPNAGWVFNGFTESFALELFEIREFFELRSAIAFAALPASWSLWAQIEALRDEHLALLEDIERRYHDFSDLDSRFHRLVNLAAPNRFVDIFYDIITLIFHYHYQWTNGRSGSATRPPSGSISRTSTRYLAAMPWSSSPLVERIWSRRRRRCCGRSQGSDR
jgi:DNA-binding GntR family transcriptional regulator